MSDLKLVGVVLAGGRSSRMGRDKAMLEYGGATLIDRSIALLREVGATGVVVSGDRPSHAGVPDSTPDLGPVGGIASVLDRCHGDAVLVLPIDLPRLDAATLGGLVHALAEAPAACFDRHPLPWAARLDDRLRTAVQAVLEARPDGPSMRCLHAALGGIGMAAPSGDRLRNVNTPEDWAALTA